jgi:hypothetical protein
MVGPDGYFRPGVGPADPGAVIVSVDFFRPEPDLDMDPEMFPTYWCDYEIRYGGELIHAYKASGMDSINALLRAMVDATGRFDGPYFNAIDGSRRYGDVIPYIRAIIKEWFDDMRIAGVEPTWIANESVIFQHADGRRVPGRIAVGCPMDGNDQHKPYCNASLTGLEDRHAWHEDGDTPLQALRLAMSSLGDKLHSFLAGGGRVLTPAGDGDVDLESYFGPLLRAATSTSR